MRGWMRSVVVGCMAVILLQGAGVYGQGAGDEQEITLGLDSSTVESMPEVVDFVQAAYPDSLQKRGVEGVVALDVLVNEQGGVDSVAVVGSVHPVLDSAAALALRQFRFEPARIDSQAVAVLLRYEYRFGLEQVVDQVAPVVNVRGRLVERGSRKPLAGAMVVVHCTDTLADTTLSVPFSRYLNHIGTFAGQYIEEGRVVTLTDSLGFFTFRSLPAGPIEVSAPVSGYEAFVEREVVVAGEELEMKCYLNPLVYSEYEVVVYGQQEKKEVSRRQLTIQEVRKIPGLSGDAIRVVQAMPGVGRASFGSGEVVVRGMPTDDSKFLLNGIEIPLLYHFGGFKSTYNSDALEAVDFYPGGFGTRYGGATAGVVEVQAREGKTDRWHATADVNLIDGMALVEGPINKKVSVLATVRRSFIGDLLKLYLDNSNQNIPLTIQPSYLDYVGRVDVRPDSAHQLYASLFGCFDSMNVLMPMMQGGSEEIDKELDRAGVGLSFQQMQLGWNWQLRPALHNQLRYGFTRSTENQSVFGFFKMDGLYLTNDIRDELSWQFNEQMTFKGGADVHLTNTSIELTIPDGNNQIVRDTIDDWMMGVVGGYANLEWRPLSNLLLIPGVRYDYYPELIHEGGVVPEFWNYSRFDNSRAISADPSLRITARYELSPAHTIKAALGNYNQGPKPLGQVLTKSWGEPTLPTTKAAHYVLGHEWQLTDLIHSDMQVYLNNQWDIPRPVERSELRPDGTAKLYYPDGRGRMYGMELMVRHDQGERFFCWLAYSLSRSERYNPRSDSYELYDEDVTNNIQIVGSWRLRNHWEVGGACPLCDRQAHNAGAGDRGTGE